MQNHHLVERGCRVCMVKISHCHIPGKVGLRRGPDVTRLLLAQANASESQEAGSGARFLTPYSMKLASTGHQVFVDRGVVGSTKHGVYSGPDLLHTLEGGYLLVCCFWYLCVVARGLAITTYLTNLGCALGCAGGHCVYARAVAARECRHYGGFQALDKNASYVASYISHQHGDFTPVEGGGGCWESLVDPRPARRLSVVGKRSSMEMVTLVLQMMLSLGVPLNHDKTMIKMTRGRSGILPGQRRFLVQRQLFYALVLHVQSRRPRRLQGADDVSGRPVWGAHSTSSVARLRRTVAWAQYSYARAIHKRPFLKLGTFHAKYHLLAHIPEMIQIHGPTAYDTQSLERGMKLFVKQVGALFGLPPARDDPVEHEFRLIFHVSVRTNTRHHWVGPPCYGLSARSRVAER